MNSATPNLPHETLSRGRDESNRPASVVAVAVVHKSPFDHVQTRDDLIELHRQRVARGAVDAPPGGLDER
jgi:hypothetical protein